MSTNTYDLQWSNSTEKADIILQPRTIDESSTSLTLMGYGYPGWAKNMQENMLYLLEQFSSSAQPSNPTEGQLWFNTNTNLLMVYFNEVWNNASGGVSLSANQPSNPQDGQLWWNLGQGQLEIYVQGNWHDLMVWIGTTAPTNPLGGSLWLDISSQFTDAAQTKSNSNIFKVYVQGVWRELNTMRIADTSEYNTIASILNILLGQPTFIGTGGSGTSSPIGSLNLISGGNGYTTAPTVTITGGGGTGALATASLAGGSISSLTITSGGTGYTSAPSISFSGGGGTGAAATCAISLQGSGVTNINLSSGGSYSDIPTVTISGGGGSGATAVATVGTKVAALAGVSLTATGANYTSVPTVTISGGGGSGATATASLGLATGGVASLSGTITGLVCTSVPVLSFSGGNGSGAIGSLTYTQSGSNYTITGYTITTQGSYSTPPNWSINSTGAATGAAVLGTMSAAIAGMTLTNAGSNYTTNPTVVISGGGGSGAAGVATIALPYGPLSSITVTNSGSGYTSVPTISFSTSTGTGGSAVAVLGSSSGAVTSVTMTNGGSGYLSIPAVIFNGGGGGSGAGALASVQGGPISVITLTNPGSAYSSTPTVTISGGGGTGASASAILGATATGALGGTWATAFGMSQTTLPIINGRHPITSEWSNLYASFASLGTLYGTNLAGTKDDNYIYTPDNSAYEGIWTVENRFDTLSSLTNTMYPSGAHTFASAAMTVTPLPGVTRTRTALWRSATYMHVVNVTFSSLNALKSYFNAGGTLNVTPSVTAATNAASILLATFINTTAGVSKLGGSAAATGSAYGIYELTTTYQTLRTVSDSGSNFTLKVEALVNPTTFVVSIRTSYTIGPMSSYTYNSGTPDCTFASGFAVSSPNISVLSSPGITAPTVASDASSTF